MARLRGKPDDPTANGLDVCLTVMLLGRAEMVTDVAEKEARLKAFVDGVFPGLRDGLRPVTAKQAEATSVLSMPIDEASAKARTGGPEDDAEDYALDIRAGVLPVKLATLAPADAPDGKTGLKPPGHVTGFKFG